MVTDVCADGPISSHALPKAVTQAESTQLWVISLYAGESVLQSAPGLYRVAVGDPSVADVRVLEEDVFLLNGVNPGHTTLMIWDETGVRSISLTVTARPPLDLEHVEGLVKTWGVKPSWWGEYLLLEGVVPSVAEKEAVEHLVEAIWDPIISLILVQSDVSEPEGIATEQARHTPVEMIQAALGMPGVAVQVVRDLVVLEGEVETPEAQLRAGEIARQFVPEVLNLIHVIEVSDTVDVEPPITHEDLDIEVEAQEPLMFMEDIEALCIAWGYTLRPLGDALILEGEVCDHIQKEALINLLQAHDLTYVDATIEGVPATSTEDLVKLRAMLEGLPGLRSITLSQKGKRLVIEGYGEDSAAIELAEALVRDYGTPLGLEVTNLVHIPKTEALRPTASLIQAQMGIPGLVVRWVGDALVLEGSLQPRLHKAAVTLAAQYSPQVVDLISERGLSALTLAEIQQLVSSDKVVVTAIGDSVVLRGEVESSEQRKSLLALASAFGYPVVDALVTNLPDEEVLLVAATDVEQAIALDMVNVRVFNETIFLEGQVHNPADKLKAQTIATTFGKDVVDLLEVAAAPQSVDENWEPLVEEAFLRGCRLYKIASTPVLEGEVTPEVGAYLESLLDREFPYWINQLTIYHPSSNQLPSLSLVRSSVGNPDVDCYYMADTLILQGSVRSIQEKERIETVASLFGVPLHSFLTVEDHVQQIWVDVCVVELSGNYGRESGIEWDIGLGNNEQAWVKEVTSPPGSGEFAVEAEERSTFGLVVGPLWAQAHLRSLLHAGHARILASPSLLTENGKQAEFLAGGEIPVPAALEGIEWKSYGVGLTVTPTVLENGTIHLQVEPEVSSLDWENAVQLDTSLVPGVRTRRWRTQAAVQPGKALVIGGLLSEEENTRQRQLPVLGKLPILGALFRSEVQTSRKTDLVVLVSPRLVQEDHMWADLLAER